METYLVDIISSGSGIIASMVMQWIPRLNDWWDKFTPGQKAGFMTLLMALFSAAIYGISCAGWLDGLIPGLGITCDKTGIQMLVRAFFFAMIGNQTTYSLIKKTGAGKAG